MNSDLALEEAKNVKKSYDRRLITAHEAYDKIMVITALYATNLEKEYHKLKREEVDKTDHIYAELLEKAITIICLM